MYRFAFVSFLAFTGCFAEEDSTKPPPPDTLNLNLFSDNDGDGYTLEEEQEAGTNPDYYYSRPYTGGYNVGFCDTPPVATGPTGEGSYDTYTWPSLAVGDVPENMTFPDQYGEEVDLYSFCGKHIMIVVSAGWCGPCRAAAEELQELQDTYRDDGLQIIEVITANNSYQRPNSPSEEFVADWAEQYSFDDIPVLAVPNWDQASGNYNHPTFLFDNDAAIPSMYHLNEKMEVVSADESIHDPGQFL